MLPFFGLSLMCAPEGSLEELLLVERGSSPIVVDHDCDGDNELVWQQQNADLHPIFFGHITRAGIRQKWQLPLRPGAVLNLGGDIDGNGSAELFVRDKDATKSWLVAYSFQLDTLRVFEPVYGVDRAGNVAGWDGEVRAIGFLHTQRGHYLIACVETGYDIAPRGILCFSWNTGALAWMDSSAGVVKDVRITDLDGDGSSEIAYTTDAPVNGNCAQGECDDVSSITIVDESGTRLAHSVLGGEYSSAYLVARDFSPRPGLELAVTVAGPNEPHSRLLLLDARLRTLSEIELPGSPGPPVATTMGGDSLSTALVGNAQGVLVEVGADDGRLRVRRQIELGDRVRPAVALQRNEATSYWLVCTDSTTLLLDEDLNVQHQIKRGANPGAFGRPAAWPIVLPGKRVPDVLIAAGSEIRVAYVPPPGDPRLLLFIIVGLLCAALGAGAGWAILRNHLRAAPAPVMPKPIRTPEIMHACTNLAHREKAMSSLNTIARRLREVRQRPEMFNGLGEPLDVFINESEIQVRRLVELTAEMPELRSASRTLGAALDAARSTARQLQEAVRRSIPPVDPEESAGRFDELAEAVVSHRSKVVALYDCDVTMVVEQALTACRGDLAQVRNLSVTVVHNRGPEGSPLHAMIWPDDLAQVLIDLVRNALHAVLRTPAPEIELSTAMGADSVIIRVSDNGRGIASDRREEIFHTGRTGLRNALATLTTYGGRIRVESSDLGQGTTMLIELQPLKVRSMPPMQLVGASSRQPGRRGMRAG